MASWSEKIIWRAWFKRISLLLGLIIIVGLIVGANTLPKVLLSSSQPAIISPQVEPPYQAFMPIILTNDTKGAYVLLGWNDLGMHCYNQNFQDIAVLPPYNNLWAQVIRRGNPPVIVSQGIRVQYSFPDNTTSSNKSNFWQYAPQLFNVNLPDNTGLTGKGLAGVMDPQSGYFVAEGIPLTEFSDSAPTTPAPYQQAVLTAKDSATGATLASLTVVAPVSTEMHCDYCHATGKDPGGNQARVD